MVTRLQLGRLGPLVRPCERTFSICNCLYGSGTTVAFRQSRIMKKLITGSKHSRKKYSVEQTPSKSLTEFGILSGGPAVKSNKSLRRVEVLNTLFMEQITSLMSTGEISEDLVGKGITISAVKVSRDFSKVNVYWIATGTESDNVIEPLLRIAGGKLRHELSQLRVIGYVPRIEFIKDQSSSKIYEVQSLLDKCDFGDDFVPTSPKNLFAQSSNSGSKIVTKIALNSDIDADGSGVSNSEEEEEDKPPETEVDLYKAAAAMRQDMLGVRHDVIMNGVKQMMSKIKVKQTQTVLREETKDAFDYRTNIDTTCVTQESSTGIGSATIQKAIDKQRKDDFVKYLRNQQISRTKELKRNSTSAKEEEFYEAEATRRWDAMLEELEVKLEILSDESQEDYYEEVEEYFPKNEEKL